MIDDIDDEKYNPVQILEDLIKEKDSLINFHKDQFYGVATKLSYAEKLLEQSNMFLHYLTGLIEGTEFSHLENTVYHLRDKIDLFLNT